MTIDTIDQAEIETTDLVIRYARVDFPNWIARRGTEGFLGGGYFWTAFEGEAFRFADEAEARAMLARFLPDLIAGPYADRIRILPPTEY